ncbi:histidine phosphatase family protein [Peptoniphilaceae bacterium SGI.137]
MTRFIFVRHAESNTENHDDFSRELSEKGMRDTRMVTDYLKDIKVDAVVSSPYRRAIDTVRAFAEEKGLEIETIDGFRERKVGNAWINDFSSFTQKQWNDFSYKLPDGECLKEVQERNISELMNLLSRFKGKTIVVGSHGTAMSTIMNFFYNGFDYECFKKIKDKMPWIVEIQFDDITKKCTIHQIE